MTNQKKTAVVLFNLGGPDSQDAVQPFLFNLFYDPAIFTLPNPFRWLLAKLVSKRRTPVAQEIYEHLGGRSPILPLTEKQAAALEQSLSDEGIFKCFIAMRYWHPLTEDTVREVKDWGADEVILMPLYPQFSTTTTDSSVNEWHARANKLGLNVKRRVLCCYPTEQHFINAHVSLIRDELHKIDGQNYRLLFSAHGLPEKTVASGDPYQWQVEQTAASVVGQLDIDGLDWTVCYQSRVGPLKWIGPSTDEEIIRAGKEEKSILLVPIAFVSEHSETLVELDIEYRKLAEQNGIETYVRVPALADHPSYVESLKNLVLEIQNSDIGCASSGGNRICPKRFDRCPMREQVLLNSVEQTD